MAKLKIFTRGGRHARPRLLLEPDLLPITAHNPHIQLLILRQACVNIGLPIAPAQYARKDVRDANDGGLSTAEAEGE